MTIRASLIPFLLAALAVAGCAKPARKPTAGLVGIDEPSRARAAAPDPDPVDALLRQVSADGDETTRVAAIRRLARSVDPRGVDALVALLQATGAGAAPVAVRRAALEGLAVLGATRGVAAVQQAMADPLPEVRVAATTALRQLCPAAGRRKHPVVVHTSAAQEELLIWANRAAELAVRGVLRERTDLAVATPGCPVEPAPPPARRRRRPRRASPRRPAPHASYRVEVSVTVRIAQPQSACRVTVLVSAEPGGALKGRVSAEARIDGAATRLRLRQSITGILASLRGDLERAFED